MNTVFYHMHPINNYMEKFNRTYEKIVKSGLIDQIDVINICVTRNIKPIDKLKVNMIYRTNFKMEIDTLKYIWKFCKTYDGNILYLHSKGVTKPHSKAVFYWVDYMEFALITHYKICLEFLEHYDTCGVALRHIRKKKYYGGNFWWATSQFIRKRPSFYYYKKLIPQMSQYYYAECWVLNDVHANPANLYGKLLYPGCYRFNLPLVSYKDQMEKEMFERLEELRNKNPPI